MHKQLDHPQALPSGVATLEEPAFTPSALIQCARRFRQSCCVLQDVHSGHMGAALLRQSSETGFSNVQTGAQDRFQTLGLLPPLYPEWLGDRSFNEFHNVRFPYIAGEMAQGIASTDMVIAMAQANMLAILGSGGMELHKMEHSIKTLTTALGPKKPWGVNLIHSPQESYMEQQAVDCFLTHRVHTVSASAFMRLNEHIVRYACSGLHRDPSGKLVKPNKVIAKISRPEVASQFMSPAPDVLLSKLLKKGLITHAEATLARTIPIAEDITVEADSGGHTDNRPLTSLLPTVALLRDELTQRYGYSTNIRIGAAGGIGTPTAAAAAFSLGAAYIVTGSINQSCREAAQSDLVKQILARQGIADVAMAPAADMFEMGVKLQVAKCGSLFAPRALKLYDLYRRYNSLEELPEKAVVDLEQNIFRCTLQDVWQHTQAFWQQRHPDTLSKALQDPKFKMALVFRWYLGKSSHWARRGDINRQTDFQIWSGPAMGAFNQWCKHSFLEHPENRTVTQVAYNLMEGAAAITRAHQLRCYGVPMPAQSYQSDPVELK
ncbi:MAG: PfaD family polyunsaturated fatty acid/polyketide biosynthesis protein [Gammaproteobacteria bacterium]|nr:PfaD family polyunsaturated fatty acid/polyketide biosynthesis protein [Gammaproteobacteria bacterium]MDH5801200.1 PfaD family polyunsaturated fatty acid/polyketide biosynthesis protein [Gammaproteobacteria bacterium]